MQKIFEGSLSQRTVEIEGSYDHSSFVAEFSLRGEDGKRRGYLYAYAQIGDVEAEVSRVALISGRTLAFSPPTEFGPISLRIQLLPTEPLPQTLTVWTVEGSDRGGDTVIAADGAVRGERIEFVPMPNSNGIAIGPGLAVFTAGDTTFSLPSEDQPDYRQQYAVRGEAFWGIGARSLESYSSGRFSFVSGTGRSMLGLVRHFPEVDFQVLDWAWYVHSSEQVYVFEREPGQSIRSKGAHPWSPDKALSLAIVNEAVQFGIGENVVYESPIPVTDPVYFAAVLGPQAFVVNCLREA